MFGLRSLLLLFFGLASLGQLQRVELAGGLAVYLHEIVMLILVLSIVLSGKIRLIFPGALKWFVLYVTISIFIHIDGNQSVIASYLYLLRLMAYITFGLVLVASLKSQLIQKTFLWWMVISSISVVAVLGWTQYLFLPDTRPLMFLGWDDHYLRLISTLFDPGFTGAVLTLGSLMLQRSLFTWKKPEGGLYSLTQGLFFLTTSALLFTYSRASFLAYASGVVWLAFRERKTRQLLVLLFFILAIFLLPRPRSEGARLERTASIAARVDTLTQSQPNSWTNFFLGTGWYRDKQVSTRFMAGSQIPSHSSAPDNSFLFVLSSLGLVGLILYARLGKALSALAQGSDLVQASLIAMGIHALFSNTLFYPFVLLYLMAIIAIGSKKVAEVRVNT